MLTFILQPYSRVNTENPYPILDLFPDLLMLMGLCKVVVLPAVTIFKWHLPGNFLRLHFSSNSLVLRKMIPHSRPKLSDFYTLFKSKLAENHTLHSGTYLHSSNMGVHHPGGPEEGKEVTTSRLLRSKKCVVCKIDGLETQ